VEKAGVELILPSLNPLKICVTEKKVWFITGCSTGLGYALAAQALASGAVVFATARSLEKLDDFQVEYPQSCFPLNLDVSRPEHINQAIAEAIRRTGRLDVVVNNAGYGLIGALEECSEEQIRGNFEVIVFGAIRMMQAVLPIMRKQKSGHIINISAAAAIANYPGFSVYGGAKWALEGISEALAAEVKPLGIKVTLVQPGPFRTDFISRSLEKASTAIPEYAATSGKFASFLEKMKDQQPGDPAQAALAIIKIVESENPPLRLVLGKYAIDKVDRVNKTRQRELEAWKDVGLNTDFSN
jgi:NAD(P)-dependent dehydrogenase (short-subunit alcohol dehydrogenase family)